MTDLSMLHGFDPDVPASGSLFGLPHGPDNARVLVLSVPFEATTSFGSGTSAAPKAILDASHQVDLCDPETGDPWRQGIALVEAPQWVPELAEQAKRAAERARSGVRDATVDVDRAGDRVRNLVYDWTRDQLGAEKIPAILGGDHSVPLGALEAAAAANPGLGILQVDAHADLREAYEGFTYSHASIFHNALERSVLRALVQVGIRDFGTAELARAQNDERIHWWTDAQMGDHLADGGSFAELVERMLRPLPQEVWISFDIDGLDPTLCPGTGTPVPGGLKWRECMVLLAALGRSGRRIVGFDLCEVGPSQWDANVGARLLYKLAGWAMHTNPKETG